MLGSVSIMSRFERMKHPLAVLMVIGLVIRFVIAPLFTFNIDMGYWAEVVDVAQNGFGLYGTHGYYYTPIWGYYLGAVTGFMQLFGITDIATYVSDLAPMIYSEFRVSAFVTSIGFNFLVKLPLVIADAIIGWLIYKFIIERTGDRSKALLGFALWFFSILVVTESVFHGTFDNLSAMFLIMAIMLMFDRKYFFAGMAFATACLTKFFPMFFVFFMIAYVLRKEGVDKEGSKQLGIMTLGAIVGSVIIYLPNIIRGDFWQSLYFLAYRLGITKETLASISPLASAAIILVVATVIIGILYVIARYGPKFMEKMNSMDEAYRNKRCAVTIGKITLAVMVIVGIFLVYTIVAKSNTMENIGSKIVMLISIFSVFLEIYLAYRLLMLKDINDHTKVVTIMFLSALAVILWTPAASYVIVIIPFICIYAAMVDNKFVKPCLVFMGLMALTEITAFLSSPTSLMLAITGNIDPLIPMYRYLTGDWILGFSTSNAITLVFLIPAFLALLYLSFKWYYARYKEGTLWTS